MAEKCTCEASEIMVFPCAGGSNVGQIANQAGVKLDSRGVARLSCLAGLGGHIPSMLESAKAAQRVVAIDGCSIGCAKATLDHAGFPPTDYVVVTDLGIEKGHHFAIDAPSIERVYETVKQKLGR